jgi:hypothetical protein
MTRSEARSGAIGRAPVKRDTDESNLQLFWLGDVRQTQEGRYACEAGVAKSVKRLRMRQAEGAVGFRHGEAS